MKKWSKKRGNHYRCLRGIIKTPRSSKQPAGPIRLAGCNFALPENSGLVISLPGAARAIRDRHLQFACFHQRQYILADSIGGRLNSQKGSNFLPDARNCAIGKQVRLCPITTRFCRLHGMTESHHKFSATVFMFRLQKASASSTISAMVPSMRLLIFLFKGSFPFTAKAVRKGGFCLHREKGG